MNSRVAKSATVTLVANDDVTLYHPLGTEQKVSKGQELVGDMIDINTLKIITINCGSDTYPYYYDDVKTFFDIKEEE